MEIEESYKMKKFIVNPRFRISYFEHLVINEYYVDQISYELVREIYELRKRITGGKYCMILTDMNGVRGISKEARSFLSSNEALEGVMAGALVGGCAVSKIISAIFLKADKPAVPYRFFTCKKIAADWLASFALQKTKFNDSKGIKLSVT